MYQVTHRTSYKYNDPVSIGNHLACLKPRTLTYQNVRSFKFTAHPEPSSLVEREDYFGNTLHIFSIQDEHVELIVETRSEVEVDFKQAESAAEHLPWEAALDPVPEDHTPWGLGAYQFRFESPRIRLRRIFADYALQSFTPLRPIREALLDLTTRIHCDFKYQPLATSVSTTVEEVFEKRRGVCQDFAHLQIACLRSIGVAARYVSGYLRTNPPPGRPRLVGADASHAWVSAYCPGAGWLDLDPTNDVAAGNDHVTVAWGRDYSDVSPLRGLILGGGVQALKVAVDVERVDSGLLGAAR
jgi:transglutaminase-like putative cysteine protease